ncbi:unnamed protein product, partial [Rotaria socialis]
ASKAAPKAEANAASGPANIEQIFDKIKVLFTPDLLKKVNSVYSFDLQGIVFLVLMISLTLLILSRKYLKV